MKWYDKYFKFKEGSEKFEGKEEDKCEKLGLQGVEIEREKWVL